MEIYVQRENFDAVLKYALKYKRFFPGRCLHQSATESVKFDFSIVATVGQRCGVSDMCTLPSTVSLIVSNSPKKPQS